MKHVINNLIKLRINTEVNLAKEKKCLFKKAMGKNLLKTNTRVQDAKNCHSLNERHFCQIKNLFL